MLQTPPSFTPLMAHVDHADPLNFVFQGGQLLVRSDDLALPGNAQLDGLVQAPERVLPVGTLGEQYCRAAWCERDTPAPDGYEWRGLRSLFGTLDDGFMGVAGRAGQIAEWARTHRFCGACATPMQLVSGERCFKCPACRHDRVSAHFMLTMMVLIRKGEHVLLAMHTASPSKRFTPLAGFLEAGESIEEAVHREVYEEVGLRVHNLQYFASQSWPFPHSLMIAFTADYLDGDIRIDENELSEARWFGPDDAWPERVPHISISSILVDAHRP
ncbi:NAD(+) diphosphatase [Massilia sp. B-10]|nr:NAD(+) diphosphatase [Massilia sp. B-10]